MFKKLLIFASFSLLAVTTAQAQNVVYGRPASINGSQINCGLEDGVCAKVPATTLEAQRTVSTTEKPNKTITVFTKEGKKDIQVQDFTVIKKGERTTIIFTPKK